MIWRPSTPDRAPWLLLLFLCAASPPATPETPAGSNISAQAPAAQTDAAAEEQTLAQARIAAASRLQQTEQRLAELAERVADLARRRDAADRKVQENLRALTPLLPLMLRMSAYPAETLLAAPSGSPEDALRGLLVLSGAARQVRDAAQAVAQERAQLAVVQAQLDAALPPLREEEATQRVQAAALDERLASARQAREATESVADAASLRAVAQAAQAADLRGAVTAVAAVPRPGAPTETGGLMVPVAGKVVRNFGEAGDAGPVNGLTYRAPSGARVVSPCSGRVGFAAPFRSYGLLLIVDCGDDIHVVLAGLARLDAQAGQTVRAGEPVGTMPTWDPADSPDVHPELYVEVRHGTEAVDPAPSLHRPP